MNKYEWLNTDYIMAVVNLNLYSYGFKLAEPDPDRGICYVEGTLWLIDEFGDIALEDVDISEFGEGFNLLKLKEPFGFEAFVANVCDGLLIKTGYDLESCD